MAWVFFRLNAKLDVMVPAPVTHGEYDDVLCAQPHVQIARHTSTEYEQY